MERPSAEGLLILDYGSQYTLLIARRLRELGAYCEIIDARLDIPPAGMEIKGIILSGGPDSVTEDNARKIPHWVWKLKVPVLGICYGLHLLVQHFGGKVRSNTASEYGREEIKLSSEMQPASARVFYDMPITQQVWMSHGDDIETLPKDFVVAGSTRGGVVAVALHKTEPVVALQFHPEVEHTEFGKQILTQFVRDLCRLKLAWNPKNMLKMLEDQVRKDVGSGKVLIAVSGGVDSTVAATLLTKALGADKVDALFIDNGLLRKNEGEWVEKKLRECGIKNLTVLNRENYFLEKLSGIDDPEQKRRLIGRAFIEVFEKFAEGKNYTHLGQGTLYPDVIESAGHGAGSKVIKSHHNVGGLPEKLALKLVEPFRYLFKDEVRVLAKELGLSDEMTHRHPFPGPGLSVRVLGAVTKDRLNVVRASDAIFIEELRSNNFYDKVWQAFTVLLPVKSVGVMGDNRTYQWTLALRAVTSSDGMTADVGELPITFLKHVADKIIRQVSEVNRVVYDVTTKPPATIEWE